MSVQSHATTARPIRETVMTLTEQRGAKRFFARGKYLAKAGFVVGVALAIQQAEGQVIITRTDAPSTKHVHESKNQSTIDLNERYLNAAFLGADRVHVRVEEGRIIISRHKLDVAVASRPRDGSYGGVFVGGGLLDEAAVQAGLRPIWGIEINEAFAETAAANHPDAAMYVMSVEEAAMCDLPRCEVISLGLPCTPWSRIRTTGSDGTKRDYGAAATDHSLGDLAFAAYSIVARLQPRTVLVECVPGLLTDSLGVALVGALRRIGYHVEGRTVDASQHGALTKRVRAVIVAQTPESDGSVPDAWPLVVPPARTIADILEPVDESAWVSRDSHPHLFARSDSNAEKGRGFVMRPTRAEDATTGTLTAEYGEGVIRIDQPILAHPTRPETVRAFTVTEAKRLMGLRDDYILPDAKTRALRLLGQGVEVGTFTPIFARATGRDATAWRPAPEAAVAVEEVPQFALAL